MPIYAYKCESCGFAKDVLQKISDPVLTECPACAQSNFKKQLTAAGFQLKGTGWYATDFKGSGAAPSAPAVAGAPVVGDSAPAAASSDTPASPAKVEAAAPAATPAPKPTAQA